MLIATAKLAVNKYIGNYLPFLSSVKIMARSKTCKRRKSRKSQNFFPELNLFKFFKNRVFIFAIGQNRKRGMRKLGTIFPRFKFSICHFLIFSNIFYLFSLYKFFSKSLFYSCNYSSAFYF